MSLIALKLSTLFKTQGGCYSSGYGDMVIRCYGDKVTIDGIEYSGEQNMLAPPHR